MPPWSCGFPAPQISKLESVVDCLVEVAASVLQFQKLVSSQLILRLDLNRFDLFADRFYHWCPPFQILLKNITVRRSALCSTLIASFSEIISLFLFRHFRIGGGRGSVIQRGCNDIQRTGDRYQTAFI